MKKENGITLIALIITIIVMLILAGVTLSFTIGEEGIITTAQKSIEEKRAAEVEERKDIWKNSLEINYYGTLGKVQTIDELVADLSKENLLKKDEATHVLEEGWVKIASREIVFFHEPLLGDYIDFQYDKKDPINLKDVDYLEKFPDREKFKQVENIKWKVLYKKDNIVYIIPYETTDEIGLENVASLTGVEAFNSLNYILDNLCEKFYSNEELGIKARSLSYKDMENLLTEEGKRLITEYYNNPGEENIRKVTYYPAVLDYPNYESEAIFNELNNDIINSTEEPKEIIQSFKIPEDDSEKNIFFSKKVYENLFDSPYVLEFEKNEEGIYFQKESNIIASRQIIFDSMNENKIYYGIKALRGGVLEYGEIFSMNEERPGIIYGNEDNSSPMGLIPIIEIDTTKYRIKDNNDNIHDSNDTFDTRWSIEKVNK